MTREINAVKKSYTKFEGQKSGWDVSIVGPEFQQGTAEAVLVTKEDPGPATSSSSRTGSTRCTWRSTRTPLQGKSFSDFGKSMEARYGNAKPIYRDEKTKGGDQPRARSLRLERRSRPPEAGRPLGVLRRLLPGALRSVDARARRRQAQNCQPGHRREGRAHRGGRQPGKDGNDENDDIIDCVVGHETKKPGTEEHADIVVPSTSGKAVSPPR